MAAAAAAAVVAAAAADAAAASAAVAADTSWPIDRREGGRATLHHVTRHVTEGITGRCCFVARYVFPGSVNTKSVRSPLFLSYYSEGARDR